MTSPTSRSRLESWKEIAAYLGKTVRTTQRWEAEGLPIHRELHRSRGYVYADPEELDTWLASRRSRAEEPQTASVPVASRSGIVLRFAAAAIVVGAIGLILAVSKPKNRQPVWLLVAATDNRSGNPQFDTIPFLLAREVGASPRIYLAPRERVDDTLRLMRKDPGSRVDEALAREVCARDTQISLIVTSRVERTSPGYVVRASLVEAKTGRRLAYSAEVAKTPEAAPAAVRKLSAAVRRAAGDVDAGSLADQARLQRVTTPSLAACQLYSQAFQIGPLAKGEPLFRAAIDRDPDFAIAHIWLADAIHYQRPADPEWRLQADRALALSATATDRERQFILASSFSMRGKGEEAAAGYAHMLALYPDDFSARRNLNIVLSNLARWAELRSSAFLGSDQRPNDSRLARNARDASIWNGDREGLHKFGERLRRILEADPSDGRDADRSERLHELWLDGKLEQVRREVDGLVLELRRVAPSPEGPVHTLCSTVVTWYQSLGRLRDAETSTALCPLADTRPVANLIEQYFRDDPAQVSKAVLDAEHGPFRPRDTSPLVVAALASGPDWDATRVRRMASQVGSDAAFEGALKVVCSRFAALRGDVTTALRDLQEGSSAGVPGFRPYAIAQCAIARAQELNGDGPGALQTLERADRGPVVMWAYPSSSIAHWHRIRYERARLLRKLGRRVEAEDIEASLRWELRLADPDHPLLTRLNTSDRKPLSVY